MHPATTRLGVRGAATADDPARLRASVGTGVGTRWEQIASPHGSCCPLVSSSESLAVQGVLDENTAYGPARATFYGTEGQRFESSRARCRNGSRKPNPTAGFVSTGRWVGTGGNVAGSSVLSVGGAIATARRPSRGLRLSSLGLYHWSLRRGRRPSRVRSRRMAAPESCCLDRSGDGVTAWPDPFATSSSPP
jgi:hypothetical protein